MHSNYFRNENERNVLVQLNKNIGRKFSGNKRNSYPAKKATEDLASPVGIIQGIAGALLKKKLKHCARVG